MPYIIDGHNLIPNIPGRTLDEVDDEMRLVELLQDFCRVKRKGAEVFFDSAPPGGVAARNFGWVTARFVRRGIPADQAISRRLQQLGGEARNYTVVSSDHAVQDAGRRARAQVISAQDFAALLLQSLSGSDQPVEKQPEAGLSREEVEDWLEIFEADEDDDEKS
jgi:hypothetical protein